MAETSPLRRRMIEDMTVRNLSPATQRSYVHAVAKFSRFFGRSPDKLTLEDVRTFQVHLASKGVAWSSLNQTVAALRFFYGVTLGMAEVHTFACAIAGLAVPGVARLAELLIGWGGKPEAAIWYSGIHVPAHHAAWVNGMMSHARDFDDIHDSAKAHAGVSVIPAALAAAELNPRATGADLLAGVTVGLELISRLGLSTTVSVVESGFLYTSLYGHFAATAAAARVMGFDAQETVNALGIAYSQAAGTHQVTVDGAQTKAMQPGFAAKTGLISVALARAGITGAKNTFEGVDGLFRSYLKGNYDPAQLRRGLGEQYELLGLSYKLYPCCRLAHSAIDAAVILHSKVPTPKIFSVTAYVNSLTRKVTGVPLDIRRAPQTVVQALFSIPYTVACALNRGVVCAFHGIRPPVPQASGRSFHEHPATS